MSLKSIPKNEQWNHKPYLRKWQRLQEEEREDRRGVGNGLTTERTFLIHGAGVLYTARCSTAHSRACSLEECMKMNE